MDTTLIDKDNLSFFKAFLLPDALEKLNDGAPVFALGAVEDGVACGALAGGPLGGSFYIESLFVASASRGHGAGSALLTELARIARLENIDELRAEYTVLCKDHETLSGFFRKSGFQFEQKPNSVVVVPLAALAEMQFYKKTQPACRVYSFSELTDSVIRAMDKRFALEAGPLFEKPIEEVALDLDCSKATLLGTNIDACLLIEKRDDALISLAYADAGSTIGSGSVFSSMLITAYRTVMDKYPPETAVLIQPVTPLSQALVERLAPNSRRLSVAAVRAL